MKLNHASGERKPRVEAPQKVTIDMWRLSKGDCLSCPGPCEIESCRHRWADGRCTLREANNGGVTLDAIGTHLGVTRQRAEQIENKALVKLRVAYRMKVGPNAYQALLPEGRLPRAKSRG